MKRYLMLGILMMKAASKQVKCKMNFHFRARAGSTEGHYNKIADEINDIDEGSRKLLEEGHKEILQSECYEEYGYPSYIR